MLTLLVASFVCLYHFGLFDSAVQAQGIWISGKNINATYGETFKSISSDPKASLDSDLLPYFGRLPMPTSISPSTNTLQVSTTTMNPEQLKATIDNLSKKQVTQGQEYDNMIASVRNEAVNLQKTYDDLKNQIEVLATRITCGMNKIDDIDSKLNSYLNKTNVAFFVQRNSTYKKQGPIPFSVTQLNVGEGMDATAGVFTAPVSGIYHFYFSGLKTKAQDAGTSSLTVRLKKNSQTTKKEMLAEGHINSQEKHGWFPVQVQATVFLKKGDQVNVELMEGSLHESGSDLHLLTGFGGFLLGF